jgi:hypothetical protein
MEKEELLMLLIIDDGRLDDAIAYLKSPYDRCNQS